MEVIRNGQFKAKEMTGTFTGKVSLTMHYAAKEPSTVAFGVVNFEPGARTYWHNHPLGQILYVSKGLGWTQCEGGPKVEIKEGDTIWCECGKRHWHGATATDAMQHIAIQQSLDGKSFEWFEEVDQKDYEAPVGELD